MKTNKEATIKTIIEQEKTNGDSGFADFSGIQAHRDVDIANSVSLEESLKNASEVFEKYVKYRRENSIWK